MYAKIWVTKSNIKYFYKILKKLPLFSWFFICLDQLRMTLFFWTRYNYWVKISNHYGTYHQKRTAKRERAKRASACVCPVWTIGRTGVFLTFSVFWKHFGSDSVEARILWAKFWNFGFWQPTVRCSLCISFRVFHELKQKKIIKSKP